MSRIHHFEITSFNLHHCLSTFISKLGFKVFAHTTNATAAPPVAFGVRLNSIIIILRDANQYHPNYSWVQPNPARPLPLSDWVSNLTVIVNCQEFDKIYGKVQNNENRKETEVVVRCNDNSSFTIATPFPHVTHTVLTGHCNCMVTPHSVSSMCECLPKDLSMCPLLRNGGHCSICDHELPTSIPVTLQPLLDYIDHVTFACDISTSTEIVKWYSDYLGFHQVSFVNTHHDEGFVLEGDNGIYLSAMQYWMCSEVCMEIDREGEAERRDTHPIQLILAEPLHKSGTSNQVQSFIANNGGPGVQHIAFHTDSITRSVSMLVNNGLSFIKPPPQYYSMMKECNLVISTKEDLDLLESNHILIDVETYKGPDHHKPIQYLLQVFSHSLFDEDTFFIELITRYGEAKGFGAGNISALWRALDLHLKSKQNNKKDRSIFE